MTIADGFKAAAQWIRAGKPSGTQKEREMTEAMLEVVELGFYAGASYVLHQLDKPGFDVEALKAEALRGKGL